MSEKSRNSRPCRSRKENDPEKYFSYLSMKRYVMGTHLKCLCEALLILCTYVVSTLKTPP